MRSRPVGARVDGDDRLAATSASRYRRLVRFRGVILSVALVALFAAVLCDVAPGPGNYPLRDVIGVLLDRSAHSAQLGVVVWDLRRPVAVLAVLVGAMLGAAGAEMQTILNNPLADPFTLGISSAASFGAALAIVLGVELVPFGGAALISG